MARISFGNLDRLLYQLDRWGKGFVDGGIKGLYAEAEKVAELSLVYVPRDTEALARSIRLDANLEELGLSSVDVKYGGPGSKPEAYAVRQHEDLTYRHKPPTQAKYLQRAVDEVAPGMALRIGESAVAAARNRAR